MKDQLPAPDFNSGQYERPNQNWVCGWAAQGQCCKIGPSPSGACRATCECRPVLKVKEGETKGRWFCTRSKDQGGACERGPLPDGTCCRPVPRCRPVRSLRAQRARFCWAVAAFTLGLLLIGLCGPWGLRIISPGEVSAQHRSFASIQGATLVGDAGCAACHTDAPAGPAGWLKAAFSASPGPFEIHKLAGIAPEHPTTIDHACMRCHPHHDFHQPNIPNLRHARAGSPADAAHVDLAPSCSSCHREHTGSGHMPHPRDESCLACHANPQAMARAYAEGEVLKQRNPAAFNFRVAHGRNVFPVPRPERGYTKVLTSFAGDHPEFQIHSQNQGKGLKETNTLRFNHQKHLGMRFATNLPVQLELSSNKLDTTHQLACAQCHKPDVAGAYHQKITFEASCKACHSLQVDERHPELVLPHGQPENVRAFIRSLDTQYRDIARRRGLTAKDAVDQFVAEQEEALRKKHGSLDQLERHIFHSNDRFGPVGTVAGVDVIGRAKYPGCAWCHEVRDTGATLPVITRPVIPDRWLQRGEFQHSKHTIVNCNHCHQVENSRLTSDILLPRKALCAECHKPSSVADSCSTCHSYHTTERQGAAPAPRAALPAKP